MSKISISQLLSAVQSTKAFTLPAMDTGVAYLYSNLYEKLSSGVDVRLADLDLDAFSRDDISTLNDLYGGIFESNAYTAERITSTLRQITPAYKAVEYI